MDFFQITAIVITLSALFGYVNVRVLKLPNSIGLMIIAIVFTGLLFASTNFTDFFIVKARTLIQSIPFEQVLLDVMLAFLLFAGAMHTNFDQLRLQRWPVLVFSTVGVLVSTFLVGTIVYFVFAQIGLPTQYIYCLLFGSLISPTDPIAVLGILKKAGVPKILETKIVGESLFNDGVGVVVFITLFHIATGGQTPGHQHATHHPSAIERQERQERQSEPPHVVSAHANQFASAQVAEAHIDDEHTDDDHADEGDPGNDLRENHNHAQQGGTTFISVVKLFGVEVLGGVLLGLILGFGTFYLLRSIDEYEIEVMITLACVVGGSALAAALHVSAPLAMVVAGLVVGNDTVRGTAMSQQTEMYVDKFWELMDIMLNAILFVLIGFEILILEVNQPLLIATGASILIVLACRFISLLLPVRFFAKKLDFVPHTTTIMTWGGLRGGISIALALMLPEECRSQFLTVTYGVVVFSIIIQGLTVGPMAKKLIGADRMEAQTADAH
jgi:CPA1 family monovalent cation:H+ antiporter